MAVVADARVLLAAADRMAGVAQRAARGEAGRLAVGYTSSAAFHPFVSRRIRAFRRSWPGVQLALEEDSTTELVRALVEERIDAAFIRSTASALSALTVDPLFAEPMLAVLPLEHPRVQAGALETTLADLAAETFVFYRRPAGQGLYDAIIAACHHAGFSPQISQEAPRLPSTMSLVAAGLGVSIMPASMRRISVEGVAFLTLTDCPGLVAPLLLATRRRGRSPIVGQFRQGVLEAVERPLQ